MANGPGWRPVDCLLVLWELPQNILGCFLLCLLAAGGGIRRIYWEEGRLFVRGRAAVSLGAFVFWAVSPGGFLASQANKRHEYGHSVQSRLLGPLYLLLVGLPSCARMLYARLYRACTGRPWTGYYRGYPESWADRLGDRSVG